MVRFLIQSQASGRFLAPNPEDGQPHWVVSLRDGLAGAVDDMERAVQLMDDWCDFDDMPRIINLDAPE